MHLTWKHYQWLELEAYAAWKRKYKTWEKVRKFPTVCLRRRRGGGVRGWVILKNIYMYTLYILEVHIGKKRILHKRTVQKNTSRTHIGLKKNLPEMLPGLTAWTLFPNSYHKKILYFVLVPCKGRFFSSKMALSYDTCGQGPRSLGTEWAAAPPILLSFFFFGIYYESSNLYVKSKPNFLCYMYVFVQKTSGLVIKIGQNPSQNW